jgi:hypothetical protein
MAAIHGLLAFGKTRPMSNVQYLSCNNFGVAGQHTQRRRSQCDPGQTRAN